MTVAQLGTNKTPENKVKITKWVEKEKGEMMKYSKVY